MLGRRLHLLSAGVTLASMVVYPAGRRGGAARRALSSVVVGGLLATTTTATVRHWGWARAAGAALVGLVGSGAVERLGVGSGRPFGRYAYTAALRPQIHGVPVIVPMAWVAMAVPAREAAHVALGSRSTPIARIAGGAVALAAWDLFLDPQMVGEGYWSWARIGRYRSIPFTNYAGWLLVGAAMMAVLEVALPPGDGSSELVAEYGTMAAMETLAFATMFRDPFVALVGGAAMLPISMLAVARLVGQRA